MKLIPDAKIGGEGRGLPRNEAFTSIKKKSTRKALMSQESALLSPEKVDLMRLLILFFRVRGDVSNRKGDCK